MMEPVQVVSSPDLARWQSERRQSFDSRETPVALTYNGRDLCVMMTTPRDLEDLQVGFSLSEGVISSSADRFVEIVPLDEGAEVRMWLAKPRADRLRSGGGISRDRQAADCAASNQSRKQYAPRPLSVRPQFSPEQDHGAMQSLPSH